MRIYDVLKISSPQIELLGKVGINPDYCRYLPLFEDYTAMRNMGGEDYLYCCETRRGLRCECEDGL